MSARTVAGTRPAGLQPSRIRFDPTEVLEPVDIRLG
jgi:hypothetical protein